MNSSLDITLTVPVIKTSNSKFCACEEDLKTRGMLLVIAANLTILSLYQKLYNVARLDEYLSEKAADTSGLFLSFLSF